jgi:3-deoxy-7-phosphoheptulonate synthase
MSPWSPSSWRSRPVRQQPTYRDPARVDAALARVRGLPPLVHTAEIDTLRSRLAEVALGRRFLLQGGDCAERFRDCAMAPIEAKLKILLQMSLVLTWGARIPVVRVARMAGQYAKPRSSATELVGGVEVTTYRGDHVNGIRADEREPDPNRLVEAYFHSAATMNYVRALLDGGFADLHHPEHWDLAFVRSAARRAEYVDLVHRILDAVDFLRVAGAGGDPSLRTVELYASHEGLLLPYEEAQTERARDGWYNVGAHFLWIGDRTRQIDGGHVEYFRGLQNPIGVKVGPSMSADELGALLDAVDPGQAPGRVTLIARYGADKVESLLPAHIKAVAASGRQVVWSCDPMHGNTTTTGDGLKTRDFDRIRHEVERSFALHAELGSHLGGVHLELTGEDVTECTGGPQELGEHDLPRSYETWCDPRLNYAQSLEMAFLIARTLSDARARRGAPTVR